MFSTLLIGFSSSRCFNFWFLTALKDSDLHSAILNKARRFLSTIARAESVMCAVSVKQPIVSFTTIEKFNQNVWFWGSKAGGLVARLHYSVAGSLHNNRLG